MKAAAVIQARTGSERLPGKVMRDVHGKPLVQRVMERVQAARTLDRVILATTTLPEDDSLSACADALQVNLFRGHPTDVLQRFVDCAIRFDLEVVVRICADNPLLDPDAIDQAVAHFTAHAPDLVGVRGAPLGIAEVQVVHRRLLEEIHPLCSKPSEREHVFPYIYRHPGRFDVRHVPYPVPFPEAARLTVDTREDLELINRIYHALERPGRRITSPQIVRFLERHADLLELNRHIVQRGRTRSRYRAS